MDVVSVANEVNHFKFSTKKEIFDMLDIKSRENEKKRAERA